MNLLSRVYESKVKEKESPKKEEPSKEKIDYSWSMVPLDMPIDGIIKMMAKL